MLRCGKFHKQKKKIGYLLSERKVINSPLSPHIKSRSDTELLLHYHATGENDVIGELYRRYTHLVFGVCMKYLKNEMDAEDAVMQIFEKLLTDLKKHQVDNFKGWLYMVAKNHCLMYLRGEQRQLQKDMALKKDFPDIVEICYDMHLNKEENKVDKLSGVESAIKELKEEQRICIELFYLKEHCYREVAELTGFTENQVKSFIQNGKRNLKIMLERQNET